jgi:hypothetical protein
MRSPRRLTAAQTRHARARRKEATSDSQNMTARPQGIPTVPDIEDDHHKVEEPADVGQSPDTAVDADYLVLFLVFLIYALQSISQSDFVVFSYLALALFPPRLYCGA